MYIVFYRAYMIYMTTDRLLYSISKMQFIDITILKLLPCHPSDTKNKKKLRA